MTQTKQHPHIVLVVARGEAVRNFLYSETLQVLREIAKVTLLSAINDIEFVQRFGNQVDQIIELKDYPESRLVGILRDVIGYAHYRWIWTVKIRNNWEIFAARADTWLKKVKFAIWKAFIFMLANRYALRFLTFLENRLSLWLKPTRDFDELFARLKPDLVFNCSHIHAPRGELPVRVAHRMGIPTATFIFSWDNLSSRGRILPPYDDYLVWHQGMRAQLLSMYPFIRPEHVFITGTPQFDYHFKPQFILSREELCARLGLDPSRPFVLYTTGMARDFPDEHRHVQNVINILEEIEPASRPQLVVRTYIKGTSSEMKELAKQDIPGVVFPPVLWEEKWFTPTFEDLSIFTSMLHHCCLGINPASTVSLELMMLDKPVINIGFDPPGSDLPHPYRWHRHIEFNHYRFVAESGAVALAYSTDDMRAMIRRVLDDPGELKEERKKFIAEVFGDTLDGNSGRRAGQVLLNMAGKQQ